MAERKLLCVGDVSDQPFWKIPEELIENLKKQFSSQIDIQVADGSKKFMSLARQADYIIGFPFPANLVRSNKKLQWVHFLTSQVPASWERVKENIKVTDSCGVNSQSVADHGMYLIYRALRGEPCNESGKSNDAAQFRIAHNPRSKCLGIMGGGAIGTLILQRCTDLFQQVNVLSRTGKDVPGTACYTPVQLSAFLANCDYVVLALPLTPESRSLFGVGFFSSLRPGATVINLARGELLEEQALLQHLKDDSEFRYLTDVTHPEPYPMDGPFMKSERVFITPHIGGRCEDIWEALAERTLNYALENIKS